MPGSPSAQSSPLLDKELDDPHRERLAFQLLSPIPAECISACEKHLIYPPPLYKLLPLDWGRLLEKNL